jgi:hypothetical protein
MCNPKLSEEMLKEDEENEKWNAVLVIKKAWKNYKKINLK